MRFRIQLSRLLVLFSLNVLFIYVLEYHVFVWAPEPRDSSEMSFSGNRANKHWKKLVADVPHRHMSSIYYNKSYDYVLERIKSYQSKCNSKSVYKVAIDEQTGIIRQSKLGRVVNELKDVRNIIVTLRPEGNDLLPVMISGHIDSKHHGPGAYDDGASIACMLEVMETLCESSKPVRYPVMLMFDGVEELGLQGARLFLEKKVNITAFLNIESLGPGLPLIFAQKGNGTTSVINALKSVKGSIFTTITDDVTKLGFITSTSDAVLFRENGIPGGELLFSGNPTKYHTSKDSIGPSSHLQLLGDLLIGFLQNFDGNNLNDNMAAQGVYPFILTMSITQVESKWTPVIIAVIVIVGIYYTCQTLISFILCFIASVAVCGSLGTLLFYFNSLSYATSVFKTFIMLGSLSILTFYFANSFLSNFEPEECSKLNLFINILLVILLQGFDSQLIFIWQLVFAIADFFLKPMFIHVMNRLSSSILFLFNFLLLSRTLLGYTSLIPGFLGEMVPIVIILLFCFFFFLSYLPILTVFDPKTHRNYVMIIISSIFIYLLVKTPVYGDSYNIQGTVSHMYYDINDSILYFQPDAGRRAIRSVKSVLPNIEEHGIKSVFDFEIPHNKGDGFAKRSEAQLPDFIEKWPEYKIENIEINETDQKVIIEINEPPANLTDVYIVVNCSTNESCVRDITEYDEFKNYNLKDSQGFRYLMKSFPGFTPSRFEFKLIGPEKHHLYILFAYDRQTPELIRFLDQFPKFIQPIGKSRAVGATVLINSTWV